LLKPPPNLGFPTTVANIPTPPTSGGAAAAIPQVLARAAPTVYPALNLFQRVMLRIGQPGMDMISGGIDGFGQGIDPNPTLILPVGASLSTRVGFVGGYIGGKLVTAGGQEEEEEEEQKEQLQRE
jgi:hypothetical protein